MSGARSPASASRSWMASAWPRAALVGNGVVEQIRRDGVVINVNGQRLLLPKP